MNYKAPKTLIVCTNVNGNKVTLAVVSKSKNTVCFLGKLPIMSYKN